jgi:cob(I)alamin adenosyltransferase
MSGMIHLYTGNGKGKTTAALGLAIRAAGAGKKVFIGQFVKGMYYSEMKALKRFSEINLFQFGLDCFIVNKPTQKDIDAARIGLAETEMAMASSEYDMYILDEVCIAIHYDLFTVEELKNVLRLKPENAELVLTGRYASDELYKIADLITEMNEVKHYFHYGIQARKGIEF